MKQYDKIYVPHDSKLHGTWMDDNYHVSHEGFAGPTGSLIEVVPMLNAVVVTTEELREIFNAGYWNAKDATNPANLGFTAFLQSKGIKL